MFEEAKRLGILVKDRSGETYVVPNTAFDVGMLDFTHPKASSWFKKILRDMVDCGVRGWMADFGEGLPLDAHLYSGFLLFRNYVLGVSIYNNLFSEFYYAKQL